MKPLAVGSLAFFLLGFSVLEAQAALPPERRALVSESGGFRIRVRVDRAQNKIKLRGMDLRFSGLSLKEPWRSMPHFSQVDGLSQWSVRCERGKVIATPDPSERALSTVMVQGALALQTPAGFLSVRGIPHREEIRVHATPRGCDVVNVVDIEKYLDSVANSEFSAEWNASALEAQIIAARTYAYFQALQAHRLGQAYDVESTVEDQVFGGFLAEHPKASQAVDRTRGKVLVVADVSGGVKPLKAYYHSTCGGQTVLPEQVWGERSAGFARGVRCTSCKRSPSFLWSLELGASEIEKQVLSALDRQGPPRDWPRDVRARLRAGDLKGVQVVERDRKTERARVIALYWGREKLRLRATQFRAWMGAQAFKSTAFDIAAKVRARGAKDAELVFGFFGKGYGHGVGLCQYGAKGLGEQGADARRILSHYYPDARLQKVW